MISVRVRNTHDFSALARRLRGASKELRSELYRGINRATKPLKEDVRDAARRRLPRSGGLGRRVASSKITTKRRATGNNAGIKIVATSGYDIGSINRGRVRHLTYGHLPWSDQAVQPGFWTEPLVAGAPAVRRELGRVMDDVAKKISRG